MKRFLLFGCICHFIIHNVYAQTNFDKSTRPDSISLSNNLKLESLIASSCFVNSNWKNIHNSSVSFTGSLSVTLLKEDKTIKRLIEFRSEIGFLKFIDSTWIKNKDNTLASAIWIKKGNQFLKNSISVSLKSQLTNTWENNPLLSNRKWKSGPLLPFLFIVSYGLNQTFWDNSYVDIGLASLKINSKSRTGNESDETKIIAKTNRVIFNAEYGFKLQSSINKKITGRLKWENRTVFFMNGVNDKSIHFDMQNVLSLRLYRFIKLRLENKIAYDLTISDEFQLYYEFVVGYSFEKNKQ